MRFIKSIFTWLRRCRRRLWIFYRRYRVFRRDFRIFLLKFCSFINATFILSLMLFNSYFFSKTDPTWGPGHKTYTPYTLMIALLKYPIYIVAFFTGQWAFLPLWFDRFLHRWGVILSTLSPTHLDPYWILLIKDPIFFITYVCLHPTILPWLLYIIFQFLKRRFMFVRNTYDYVLSLYKDRRILAWCGLCKICDTFWPQRCSPRREDRWKYSFLFIKSPFTFFLAKFIIVISLVVLIRASTPRYRYDYLSKLGWLKFLGYSVFAFFSVLLLYFFW